MHDRVFTTRLMSRNTNIQPSPHHSKGFLILGSGHAEGSFTHICLKLYNKLCCIFVLYDWLQILKISSVFLFFICCTVTLSCLFFRFSEPNPLLLLDGDSLYHCSMFVYFSFIMLFSTHKRYHSLPYYLSITHQHYPLNVIYLFFVFFFNLLVNHLHIIPIIGLFE